MFKIITEEKFQTWFEENDFEYFGKKDNDVSESALANDIIENLNGKTIPNAIWEYFLEKYGKSVAYIVEYGDDRYSEIELQTNDGKIKVIAIAYGAEVTAGELYLAQFIVK